MSQPPAPADDDLQFVTTASGQADRAVSQNCAICAQPIETTYYAINDKNLSSAGKILCPACAAHVNERPKGVGFGRLLKATFFGLVAGIIGAIIWFAIRRAANIEVGLVAILVGFMVGKAVRFGSGGRGGRGYQILAVVLTYCCIAANYMPDIFEAVFKAARENQAGAAAQPIGNDATQNAPNAKAKDEVADENANPQLPKDEEMNFGQAAGALALLVVLVFGLALAAPFLAGVQNIIGLLIIGFALWEAWKFNARHDFSISGPYQVGPQTTA